MTVHQADPSTLWTLLTRQAKSLPKPGDEIALAPGEYPPMPVELRSAWTLRSAEPREPALITRMVSLNARGAKALNLRIRPGEDPAAISISAPDCQAAWCDVFGFAGRGIRIDEGGEGAWVHHNWVHDQLTPTGSGVACIISGLGRGTTDVSMKALIEYNLIERCKVFQGIEFKSSDNIAASNTLLDGAEIVVRHGARNKSIANWVENGLIGLCGDDPISFRDHVEGQTPNRGEAAIAIRAGSVPPGPPQAHEYVPARRALVLETDSPVRDGWVKGDGKSWTHRPVGSRKRRFGGRVILDKMPGGLTELDSDGPLRELLQRRPSRLTREQVGPGGSHDPSEPQEPGPVDPGPGPQPEPQPVAATVAKALERALDASGDLDDCIERIRAAKASQRRAAETAALNEAEALRGAVRKAIKALKAA